MSADTLLDRLPRLKRTKTDNYISGCPVCQSRRGRPISVRVLDDGRILLHAFCGCETGDVLAAIGLTMGDLFEKPLAQHLAPSHSRIPARDLLQILSEEALYVGIVAADIRDSRAVTPEEWDRLAVAVNRIVQVASHAR